MAAFENQSGPDLDLFVGQTWSDWQNAVESDTAESHSDTKFCSKQSKEVAKLKRQDFGLFGYCPAKDDFFVVVCEHCRLPVKPQAFSYHIEKYHKEKAKSPASSLKKNDSGGRSTLFNALSVLNCDNSLGESPTPSESSTNSTEFVSSKPPLHVYSGISGGKKIFKDGVPASPNSKKRASSGQDLPKVTKSPSKAKHLKLDKESSPLTQRNVAKVKVSSTKKPTSSSSQSTISTNLASQSPSSSQFLSKDTLNLPISTDPPPTSLSLSVTKAQPLVLNNAPVVILEKSSILENPIAPPHSQTSDHSSDVFSFPSSTSLPSTSYRQYTHHYNPQFDIVKSPDRGPVKHQVPPLNLIESENPIPVKPKKIKVRDYDPNMHCGVWISDENTHCTRSFTCKFHAKRSKRKVQGRRKPFDDMLREHLRARNKGKNKSESSVSKPVNAQCVSDGTSSATTTANSDTSMHLPVTKFAMQVTPLQSPTSNKVLSPTGSKNKTSVQLFPRSSTFHLVDLWQDATVQYEDIIKNNDQAYTSKHPSPLTICQYGSRQMGSNNLRFNRGPAFQCNVLSNMNKQVQRHSFVNLVELNRTTSHFASPPSVSASLILSLKSEKEARQRQFNSAASSASCLPSCARTKLGPRFFSHPNARLRAGSMVNKSHPNISLSRASSKLQSRRKSLAPESTSHFAPMPLDHRLSLDSRASTSRSGSSEMALSSDVNLVLKQDPTSVPFPTNRKLSYNQHSSPHITIHNNRDGKHKVTLNKQSSLKHNLSTLNGISSNALPTRTISHRTIATEPPPIEDYTFSDDSANSKTIQLNQTDPSGRRARFSQDANKSIVTNTIKVNSNSTFDPVSNTDQILDLLSGGTTTSITPCKTWQVHNDSSTLGNPIIDKNARQNPGILNSVENPNTSDNWTTEFLSILEPDGVTKNPSASSSQDFSYSLRDNFLNFSNDASNIAEVSNT